MLTGCTAHGRFLGRVCVLSFRTHQPQIDALVEDMAAAIAEIRSATAMTEPTRNPSDRERLRAIAVRAMRERGLEPDHPARTRSPQAAALGSAPRRPPRSRRAICGRCSGARSTTTTRAISISCRWPRRCRTATSRCWSRSPTSTPRSPKDRRSIGTPRRTRRRSTRRRVIFPMLPERLSTDLDVARPIGQDRLAVVIEFVVVAGRRADERPDVYGAPVQQPGEARLQRRRRLAGRRRAAAAGGRGRARHGRAAAHAGSGRAGARRRCARSTARSSFETIEVEHVFDGDTLHDVRAAGRRTARKRSSRT